MVDLIRFPGSKCRYSVRLQTATVTNCKHTHINVTAVSNSLHVRYNRQKHDTRTLAGSTGAICKQHFDTQHSKHFLV